jgi:hypothetical protein
MNPWKMESTGKQKERKTEATPEKDHSGGSRKL